MQSIDVGHRYIVVDHVFNICFWVVLMMLGNICQNRKKNSIYKTQWLLKTSGSVFTLTLSSGLRSGHNKTPCDDRLIILSVNLRRQLTALLRHVFLLSRCSLFLFLLLPQQHAPHSSWQSDVRGIFSKRNSRDVNRMCALKRNWRYFYNTWIW